MYHTLTINQTLKKLQTSATQGLSTDQVTNLQQKYGFNDIPEGKKETIAHKIIRQFSNILVLVLIIAALVSFALGETLDASVILVIVLINALMGYIQERRAEKAISALKKLSTDYAEVIRDGNLTRLSAKDLVPGDILILEPGDKVPADARLIEAVNLELSEAVLTGESAPVKKHTDQLINLDLPLGDRANMVYKNTTVGYGRGKAIVTAIGLETEIGKISVLLQTQDQKETPLSKELNVVGKRLSAAAIVIILLLFVMGNLINGFTLKETFLTSISLAVAAIPEGLPAVVTISLALGVSKLAKHNAIVRKLQAVETLGATNYILTDKTGTLTQNKMSVTNIATLQNELKVSEKENKTKIIVNDQNNLIDLDQNLLIAMAVCNDADYSIKNEKTTFLGDSTETALLELVYYLGNDPKEIRQKYPRLFEIPFSSETKKMLVAVQDAQNPEEVIIFAKGAPEVIEWMVTTENQKVAQITEKYAKQGLRSLAFSYKTLSKRQFDQAKNTQNPEDTLSTYHEFLAIVAQKDPLRPEVKQAIQIAHNAGIKTIMLTGDHKLTATNIALELGLITGQDEVMDGSELGNKKDQELIQILQTKKVFARVSPQQKLDIVKAVQQQGNITAVTGDGVNDAPAIKAADIGIAMGISGTDVSKEVSDMVLQDDNYATIVEAISQGRIIYDNLIKFITYLISCNMSEILLIATVMLVGAMFHLGVPIPLLPIQILWINLVSDGFPALALGVEPGEKDVMMRLPRKQDNLLNTNRWLRMFFQAILMTTASFIVFWQALGVSTEIAQTAALTTLVFAQLLHALNSKSEVHSIFSKKLGVNKALVYTVGISLILQFLVVYTPFANIYLKTTPLPYQLMGLAIGMALIPVVGTEVVKFSQKNNVHIG